jgi:hypothetical protein
MLVGTSRPPSRSATGPSSASVGIRSGRKPSKPLGFRSVYEFRDGRCVRVDGFRDKAEALEAAELRE